MVLIITNAATARTEVVLTLAAQWVGFSRELLFVSRLEGRNTFLPAAQKLWECIITLER